MSDARLVASHRAEAPIFAMNSRAESAARQRHARHSNRPRRNHTTPAPARRPLPLAHPAVPPTRYELPPSAILPAGHFAGRLRYDTLVNGRASILATWLLVTTDRQVAERVVALHGGQPQPHIAYDGQPPTYHVLTDHPEIEVLLDGPQAIRLRMLRRHGSTCCAAATAASSERRPAGGPANAHRPSKGVGRLPRRGGAASRWSTSPSDSPRTRCSAASCSPAPPGRSPTTP